MKHQKGSRQGPSAQEAPARLVRHASGAVRVSKKVPLRAPPTEAAVSSENAERTGLPRRGRLDVRAAMHAAISRGLERVNVPPATLLGGAIGALAIAAHWLVPAGAWHLLFSLAPLSLLVIARVDPQPLLWGLHAGLLWLALAWAELVHPTAGSGRPELYRLLSLTVLAVVFFHLREAAQHIRHLSQRDPLTGLLNRRGFEELSATELQRAARYERPIAFAVLDVDRFKAVNDLYGHAAGDRVLRIVSDELLKLRTSDLAVRLGGDEFGLLMPETDALGAEQLVQRLRQRIHCRMSEHGWPVTVSAGVASSASCARRLSDLIADADRRMYACKTATR
jgi:diguanylate cyclase (GGDEF)-like protein